MVGVLGVGSFVSRRPAMVMEDRNGRSRRIGPADERIPTRSYFRPSLAAPGPAAPRLLRSLFGPPSCRTGRAEPSTMIVSRLQTLSDDPEAPRDRPGFTDLIVTLLIRARQRDLVLPAARRRARCGTRRRPSSRPATRTFPVLAGGGPFSGSGNVGRPGRWSGLHVPLAPTR